MRELALVGAIEAAQRTDQFVRGDPTGDVEILAISSGQDTRLANRLPEVEVGHRLVGRVVVHRNAGHLDDARLDGVHEREVADHPREDEPLLVARAGEVERRSAEVVDLLDANHLGDRLDPGEPPPRVEVALFGLGVLRFGVLLQADRLVDVAVVRLVVENQDLALSLPASHAPAAQDPGNHGRLRLLEWVGLALSQDLAGRAGTPLISRESLSRKAW